MVNSGTKISQHIVSQQRVTHAFLFSPAQDCGSVATDWNWVVEDIEHAQGLWIFCNLEKGNRKTRDMVIK